MKKHIMALFLLIGHTMVPMNQVVWSSEHSEHSHCRRRIGNFCHHNIPGVACLRYKKNLSECDLDHFIQEHLGTDIFDLDLSDQENVNDHTIEILAKSKNASAINTLDLMFTDVGYNGIVALWKSETFGSLVSDSPTYERHTGKPVSIIEIEIGHTKLMRQYRKCLFSYPLPLREEFPITFGHMGMGKSWQLIGYKQIKLLNHGKELTKQSKA